MLAPVKYSLGLKYLSVLSPADPYLATEPVSMTPRSGRATTGTREETSSGSASVVQSTATSRITQPVRSFWRQVKNDGLIPIFAQEE